MSTREVFLHGNAGKLQGNYTDQNSPLVALVLPPHPMYKGTMQNKVVIALYEAFVRNKFSTLRINFRGVQKSLGSISKKDDELIKDANTALSWLEVQNPFLTHLWVSGFSFGAWLSMNLVMRRPEIAGFIGVCPPTKNHDFSFIFPCTVPGLIINAGKDILAKEQENIKISSILSSRIEHFESHTIPDADYKLSKQENIREVFEHSSSFLLKVVPQLLNEDATEDTSDDGEIKNQEDEYISSGEIFANEDSVGTQFEDA